MRSRMHFVLVVWKAIDKVDAFGLGKACVSGGACVQSGSICEREDSLVGHVL